MYLPAEHDAAPVPTGKYIRGDVHFSGFVFRRRGGDCLATLMTQTDISVALPDFLVGKFVSLAVRVYVRAMRRAAQVDG